MRHQSKDLRHLVNGRDWHRTTPVVRRTRRPGRQSPDYTSAHKTNVNQGVETPLLEFAKITKYYTTPLLPVPRTRDSLPEVPFWVPGPDLDTRGPAPRRDSPTSHKTLTDGPVGQTSEDTTLKGPCPSGSRGREVPVLDSVVPAPAGSKVRTKETIYMETEIRQSKRLATVQNGSFRKP